MDNKALNKTALDIVKEIKEHRKNHSEYTAMTLASGIVDKRISTKPWEEPDQSIIAEYVDPVTIKELTDLGLKFEFYPYKSHTEIRNGIEFEIADTLALAVTWYKWTRLDDIFRQYNV